MEWNWQQPGWPDFAWDAARLIKAEQIFLVEAGEYAGTIKHLGPDDRDQITVEAMSMEAVTTSEIEGEILDRASVQSSILRQLGLAASQDKVGQAEQGVAEVMVDLHRTFAARLTDAALFQWHQMLMAGRRDLRDVGGYRTHADAMQVVSGPLHAPNVHFEAPPSSAVTSEMSRFLDWFQRTSPTGPEPLPALTRAGIAHLYFVCIHPFEDGNGRIGRAVAEKALAEALGRPTLTALAATILLRRKGYYAALEANNKGLKITPWLTWFATAAIEAQRRATTQVDFLLDKTRLLDRLRDQINDRQRKALLRMLREGPEGFKGGMTAGKYETITGASPATATRDLVDLVDKQALVRVGERRYARYELAILVRPVKPVEIDGQGNVR